jgi:AcrR family transcriptional regulator
VFARDGYINARLSDIADEAGRSMASFYNYYDSKEAVLVDIASDFDAELQSLVAEPFRRGLPTDEALREAITGFWRHYHRRLPEVVGIFHASLVEPDFAQRWREIRANGIRTIAHGLRRAQADGFAPGLDPLVAASALSSMMEHFCYVWLAQGGDAVEVEMSEQLAVDTLWTLWMHAVYWPGDGAARPQPVTAPPPSPPSDGDRS